MVKRLVNVQADAQDAEGDAPKPEFSTDHQPQHASLLRMTTEHGNSSKPWQQAFVLGMRRLIRTQITGTRRRIKATPEALCQRSALAPTTYTHGD